MMNNRKSERITFKGRVDLRWTAMPEGSEVWGHELSENGIFLKTNAFFEKEEHVSLAFVVGDRPIIIHDAKVRWRKNRRAEKGEAAGIGLSFEKMSIASLQSLRAFIEAEKKNARSKIITPIDGQKTERRHLTKMDWIGWKFTIDQEERMLENIDKNEVKETQKMFFTHMNGDFLSVEDNIESSKEAEFQTLAFRPARYRAQGTSESANLGQESKLFNTLDQAYSGHPETTVRRYIKRHETLPAPPDLNSSEYQKMVNVDVSLMKSTLSELDPQFDLGSNSNFSGDLIQEDTEQVASIWQKSEGFDEESVASDVYRLFAPSGEALPAKTESNTVASPVDWQRYASKNSLTMDAGGESRFEGLQSALQSEELMDFSKKSGAFKKYAIVAFLLLLLALLLYFFWNNPTKTTQKTQQKTVKTELSADKLENQAVRSVDEVEKALFDQPITENLETVANKKPLNTVSKSRKSYKVSLRKGTIDRVFTLKNPSRIVVDLVGAKYPGYKDRTIAKNGVSKLRIGRPDKKHIRVVLELDSKAEALQIHANKTAKSLELSWK